MPRTTTIKISGASGRLWMQFFDDDEWNYVWPDIPQIKAILYESGIHWLDDEFPYGTAWPRPSRTVIAGLLMLVVQGDAERIEIKTYSGAPRYRAEKVWFTASGSPDSREWVLDYSADDGTVDHPRLATLIHQNVPTVVDEQGFFKGLGVFPPGILIDLLELFGVIAS